MKLIGHRIQLNPTELSRTFMTLSYLRLPSSFSSTGGSLGPTWLGRGAAGEEEQFECSRQDEGQQNGPFADLQLRQDWRARHSCAAPGGLSHPPSTCRATDTFLPTCLKVISSTPPLSAYSSSLPRLARAPKN